MLDPDDLANVTSIFKVAEQQVRRDHLIGHVLAALERLGIPDLVFFGGTGLTWTHLPRGRLSEDIDLHVLDRADAAQRLEAGIVRLVRREFPGTRWEPGPSSVRSTDPARLVTAEGLSIRVQLLDSERQGWGHFPVEERTLVRRYRDIGAVCLQVPTRPGFAAMKTLAWVDRAAARDLFDLAGLAEVGALDGEAARIFQRATGRRLLPHDFATRPPHDWQVALGHQTGSLRAAEDCLRDVRSSYATALGWG